MARRILDHLGFHSQGPPVTRVQAPPELFEPGPDYDVAAPAHGDAFIQANATFPLGIASEVKRDVAM